MSVITRYWKKVLYFLVTGSTSVFIAACYGMPAGFGDLGSWTIRTTNNKNQPIEGLEITVLQYIGNAETTDTIGYQKADSTGTALFFLRTYDKDAIHKHEAIIRDIDGNENGGNFQDTLIVKGSDKETVVQMDIAQ